MIGLLADYGDTSDDFCRRKPGLARGDESQIVARRRQIWHQEG